MGRASPAKASIGHQLEVAMATTAPLRAMTASAIQMTMRVGPAPELAAFIMTTTLQSLRPTPAVGALY